MTHPDLYLNSEAQVLDITSKDLNLYWWIGLGGEATRIQSASIYYKKPSIDLLSQSFSPVIGQFNKLNWACDVDWFNEDSSWRGWIPVYADDPPLAPWFMKMDKPMATIKKDGALLFNPSGAVNCKHDFFTVDELVKLVSNLHTCHQYYSSCLWHWSHQWYVQDYGDPQILRHFAKTCNSQQTRMVTVVESSYASHKLRNSEDPVPTSTLNDQQELRIVRLHHGYPPNMATS